MPWAKGWILPYLLKAAGVQLYHNATAVVSKPYTSKIFGGLRFLIVNRLSIYFSVYKLYLPFISQLYSC
jgi:hypothetical protein